MIQRNDYDLTIMMNGKDTGIDNDYYVSFTLTEDLNYNFYYGELCLKQNIFWDFLWTTRETIDISVKYRKNTYEDLQKQLKDESVTYYQKSYKFIVFDYQLTADTVILTLAPWFFPSMSVAKKTIGYNEQIEVIAENICNSCGITDVETEPVSASKRLLLQLGQSNIGFMRDITEYTNGFMFFINKNYKARFLSYATLMGIKKPVLNIHSSTMNNLKMENNIYAMEALGGLGGTEYYFDWDKGSMNMYNNTDKKYGMFTNDINPKNNIMMGNPIAKDFYPGVPYNHNMMDNLILNTNLFKIFLHFDVYGIYNVCAGDKVYLEFMRKTTMDKHDHLSGEYLVYGVSYAFENKALTHLICSAPFFFKEVKNFSGKGL